MKLRHEEIKIKILVPEGYYIAEVLPDDQPVVPRIAYLLGNKSDYNTISDMITARITIKKDIE